MSRSHRIRALRRISDAGKGPLRVPPRELAVVDARLQRDSIPGAGWNVEPVVDGVGGPRRNQSDVRHRSRGPCVPFVDRISMLIELEASVEMGATIHGAGSAVLKAAAVKDGPAAIVIVFART